MIPKIILFGIGCFGGYSFLNSVVVNDTRIYKYSKNNYNLGWKYKKSDGCTFFCFIFEKNIKPNRKKISMTVGEWLMNSSVQ